VRCTPDRRCDIFLPPTLSQRTLTSASLNTIAGALPPSSMVMRFICAPTIDGSFLPTGVEPVKGTSSIPFRNAYLQSLIDVVEIDDDQIRIKGSKDVLRW
jgi:hypothetical protein